MTLKNPIRLIVNADDYAYFDCVSRGILEAVNSGSVTATGILANSPNIDAQLRMLDTVERLDLGIHLNLTSGKPLTAQMANKLTDFDGFFPSVYQATRLLLQNKIRVAEVRTEWRAQIDLCRNKKLVFLNSHEHIHMLPILFPVVIELAKEFQIPNIRLTKPDWYRSFTPKLLIRNSLIEIMYLLDSRISLKDSPRFLGFGTSGKLNLAYLKQIFSRLQSGQTYELMCHPGRFDSSEINDPKLTSYHEWEAELNLLQSSELKELYQQFDIHLSYYQP